MKVMTNFKKNHIYKFKDELYLYLGTYVKPYNEIEDLDVSQQLDTEDSEFYVLLKITKMQYAELNNGLELSKILPDIIQYNLKELNFDLRNIVYERIKTNFECEFSNNKELYSEDLDILFNNLYKDMDIISSEGLSKLIHYFDLRKFYLKKFEDLGKLPKVSVYNYELLPLKSTIYFKAYFDVQSIISIFYYTLMKSNLMNYSETMLNNCKYFIQYIDGDISKVKLKAEMSHEKNEISLSLFINDNEYSELTLGLSIDTSLEHCRSLYVTPKGDNVKYSSEDIEVIYMEKLKEILKAFNVQIEF